jgi:hypothetical protein
MISGKVFALPFQRCFMSDKKRQKKAGQDKNKKIQARRRRRPSTNGRGSSRQREIST